MKRVILHSFLFLPILVIKHDAMRFYSVHTKFLQYENPKGANLDCDRIRIWGKSTVFYLWTAAKYGFCHPLVGLSSILLVPEAFLSIHLNTNNFFARSAIERKEYTSALMPIVWIRRLWFLLQFSLYAYHTFISWLSWLSYFSLWFCQVSCWSERSCELESRQPMPSRSRHVEIRTKLHARGRL